MPTRDSQQSNGYLIEEDRKVLSAPTVKMGNHLCNIWMHQKENYFPIVFFFVNLSFHSGSANPLKHTLLM